MAFEIQSIDPLSTNPQLVAVLWHFKKGDGLALYSATIRYMLKVGDDDKDCKIVSVIMVNELTEFSQLKV